jgi:hypothetical protein
MPVIPSAVASTVIASAVASTVIAAAVIASAVIAAIVSIPWVITIIRIAVVWIGAVSAVIARSVDDWEWYREPKGKANTGARRRFREERQPSDRNNEDNVLLHKNEESDETNIPRIQEIVRFATAQTIAFIAWVKTGAAKHAKIREKN